MSDHISVVVIGAGQAGLATSFCLKQHGVEHVVFDNGRVGNSWRSRWDSFRAVTQNWQSRLPGMAYDGDEPADFMTRDEIVRYVEAYAELVDAPLMEDTSVHRLRSTTEGLYEVETTRGRWIAEHVVICTGAYPVPKTPAIASGCSPSIQQLHSSEYRNAERLTEGGVLVVGSGQSGCQIVEDLLDSGRAVHLSVGRTPRVPRSYRGRDILEWGKLDGRFEQTVKEHPLGVGIREKSHPHLSSQKGGSVDLRGFAQRGVRLHGRLLSFSRERATFADDLGANLDFADVTARKFTKRLDRLIDRHGIDAPPDDAPTYSWTPKGAEGSLDLHEESVGTVLWATGYRFDYSWIDLPIFDGHGRPEHERGVTGAEGIYFVGLPWLYSWGSALFYGVGQDAQFVADHIAMGT